MLTEYEVRQRVREIRSSTVAPMRKVRLYLKLGRSLRSQFRLLSQAKDRLSQSADRNATAGISRMTQATRLLHEDVREQAMRALKAQDPSRIDLN